MPPSYILNRPVVWFDLETTGLDFTADHIIEIGGSREEPDGTMQDFDLLVKPSEPIPSEITELTGITNEMVKDAPTFAQVAHGLLDIFKDADLAGYSVGRFDAPFLAKKFEQTIGLKGWLEGRLIIDPRVIYHKREGRHLADAVRFYCGREFVGAHRAKVDALAGREVMLAQISHYGFPAPMSIEELAKESAEEKGNFVDSGRKLFWRNGEAAFNFGKHRSKLLRRVCSEDRSYLDWLVRQEFDRDFMEIIIEARKGIFPIREMMDQNKNTNGGQNNEKSGSGEVAGNVERS